MSQSLFLLFIFGSSDMLIRQSAKHMQLKLCLNILGAVKHHQLLTISQSNEQNYNTLCISEKHKAGLSPWGRARGKRQV